MHCILKTEDKCDSDRTEEMVVCSILEGDLGSNNSPVGLNLGARGYYWNYHHSQFTVNLSFQKNPPKVMGFWSCVCVLTERRTFKRRDNQKNN